MVNLKIEMRELLQHTDLIFTWPFRSGFLCGTMMIDGEPPTLVLDSLLPQCVVGPEP